jgi:flagellar basal-body rod protein FlgB
MNTGDIPLLSMLRQRLGYLSDRQKVIAENVANADTPGYLARDVKPFRFDSHLADGGAGLKANSVQPAQTRPGHIAGKPMKPPPSPGRIVKAADSETTLDGNGVVLEDQMIKMTETRMQYDAAIGFYQKSMALLRMAARPPGR